MSCYERSRRIFGKKGKIAPVYYDYKYGVQRLLEECNTVKQVWDDENVPFFRVVVMTDSAYLVNGITDHVWKWEQNGWLNSKGRTVVNDDDLWKAIHAMICMQHNNNGFEVCFWHVNRESNTDADKLAKSVLYG